MSFLYSVIILPIESLIEFVFCFVLTKFDKFGVGGAIVAVSLAVNFLALPLYNMADSLQLKERNLQLKMAKWINHIKKTFTGDEQFMILNAYYRENNYHPLYALRSALSIMIEVPFFIAGYHFLSHCPALDGQSVLFLKDLGKPDGLIPISFIEHGINFLPILMTLINVVSSAIYTKNAPIRERVQVYALALIFLVILYNSPSGLVFYWILNNTFSLAKNIILKMKKPKMIVYIIISGILLFACVYLALYFKTSPLKKRMAIYILTILFIASPFAIQFLKKLYPMKKMDWENFVIPQFNFRLLLFSCVSLWILSGILLPSSVIATSPEEFSFLGNTDSPITYILSSSAYFFGIFILWPLCIYKMFDKKTKLIMPPLFFVLALCALANVYIFKHNYGLISVFFGLEDGGALKQATPFLSVLPLILMLLLISFVVISLRLKKNFIPAMLMLAVCLSEGIFSIIKITDIKKSFNEYKIVLAQNEDLKNPNKIDIEYNLSKTEKNVVILFLDRAISSFFPYILKQFPDLNKNFEGFTYYPNCLSFANGTLMGAPALLGGYEYMPDEINLRKDETLVSKHNEALKVMPHLFYESGFNVTLSDPCDANYKDKYGFEVFDDYPKMNVKSVMGKYSSVYAKTHEGDAEFAIDDDQTILKSSKRFSIMQMLLPSLRDSFYNGGHYYQLFPKFQSSPNRFNCIDSYSALYFLKECTDFSAQEPTFTMIYNLLMHEPMELRAPDYTPGTIDENHPAADTGVYKALSKSDTNGFNDFSSYHVNAAGIKMVGTWLSYLKENNVYDNTKIIIVADHGHSVPLEQFGFSTDKTKIRLASFNPLLLVKDFDSHGKLKISNEFMTNAETVNFAIEGLEIKAENPFTHKKFLHAKDFESFNVYTPKASQRGGARMRKNFLFETDPKSSFTLTEKDIFNENNWRGK